MAVQPRGHGLVPQRLTFPCQGGAGLRRGGHLVGPRRGGQRIGFGLG
jgi:hypothetical protein